MAVKKYSIKRSGDKYISVHFKVKEFQCHNGTDTVYIDSDLLQMLEQVRAYFGKPVYITSGYRTEEYNKSVGGATHSYHVKGMASDIQVSGVSPDRVYQYCNSTFTNSGVGKYNSFTHIDCRGYRARW